MSGHSKWSTIKHKKGAADAARGQVFTRHAKNIAVAARQGGADLSMNSALRVAVDLAKRENMPNANIERAIKRGTGELGGAVQTEMLYEGYGPGGVAILVSALTDNKNRTVASVRAAFSKSGGALGESGSVAWMFAKKGIITVEMTDEDALFAAALDAGALDVSGGDGVGVVFCESTAVAAVSDALAAAGFSVDSANAEMVPNSTIEISDAETARKIERLVDALEEDDDVTSVSGNYEITVSTDA